MSTPGVEFSSSGIGVTAQLFPTPYLSNRLNIPFLPQLARIYLLGLDFTRPALAALRDRLKDLKWVLYVAYRFAWNRSYPVGVASPSGDTDVKLVIASRSPYLNRPIPTSGNQCSIEWVKNNRFDGTLMRLKTID